MSLIDSHQYGEQDLEDSGQMSYLVYKGSLRYTETATDPEVKDLRRLRYRNALRNAVYEIADKLVQE